MTTQAMTVLIIQGLIFVLWAFMMFLMLWKITKNASALNKPRDGFGAQTGNQFRAFFGFFRDPENRPFLIRLGLLTVLLMATNVAGVLFLRPT